MKKIFYYSLATICLFFSTLPSAYGEVKAAAAIQAGTWQELREAVQSASGSTVIQLTADVESAGANYLEIKGKQITIDGTGHTIRKTSACNSTSGYGFLFVADNGELSLKDITIDGGGIKAKEISSPTIVVGTSQRKGGVLNLLSGCTIVNCYGYYGGAIRAIGSQLNISTGVLIAGNVSEYVGGAICADNGSSVHMDGGTIERNQANGYGGAIYNGSRIFLSGGRIENNTAGLSGGGIYSSASKREAPFGVIANGNPVIKGNKVSDSENNVYFDNDLFCVYLRGALSDGAYIGITPSSGSQGQQAAAGYEGYTVSKTDISFLHHDRLENGSSTYEIVLDGSGNKAILGDPSKNCELYFSSRPSKYIFLQPGISEATLDFILFVNGEEVTDADTLRQVRFEAKKTDGFEAAALNSLEVISIAPGGAAKALHSGIVEVTMSYKDTVSSNTALIVVPGDVNKDGVCDTKDAAVMGSWIFRPERNEGYIPELADMNGDGKLDIADLSILAKMLRG